MKKLLCSIVIILAVLLCACPVQAFTISAGASSGVTCTGAICETNVTGYGSVYWEVDYSWVTGDNVGVVTAYINTATSLTAPYYPQERNPVTKVLEDTLAVFPGKIKKLTYPMALPEPADKALLIFTDNLGTGSPSGTGTAVVRRALPGVKQ